MFLSFRSTKAGTNTNRSDNISVYTCMCSVYISCNDYDQSVSGIYTIL